MGTESNYYKEIISKLESLTKREYTLFASLGIQGAVMAGVSVFTFVSFFICGEDDFNFNIPDNFNRRAGLFVFTSDAEVF